MADIEVFGIGLDTSSAVRNAKNLEKALLDVSKSSGKVTKSGESMAGAMLKSQIAFAALSKAANFLTDQLKQSVTVGASFEQQMAKVGAVSKATAEQQKALSAAAKEMGRTTQFSATEAASALEAMSRAGFKAQQSIAALPKVLQLSAASGVSLGESADIVTNVMSSMGKQVSELSHVNNVLVETFTSSNTTLESLASSISYAGGIAATTGVSFEQLNGFLGIFGNAGVSGTRAGTALRQAMATLIDPTKKAADTLRSLNVEVGQNLVETLRDLERAGASSKDMIAIFGTEAGGALLTLQQSGGIAAVEEMAHQLKNVGDVADEIAKKQMDTLQGSFTKLSSAVEGIRISIFEDLIRDDLKIFIDGLTESIQNNEQSFRAVVEVGKIIVEQFTNIVGKTSDASGKVEDLTGKTTGLTEAFSFAGKVMLTLGEGFNFIIDTIGTATRVYAGFITTWAEGFGDASSILVTFGQLLKAGLTGNLTEAESFATALRGGIEDATDSAKNSLRTLGEDISGFADRTTAAIKRLDKGYLDLDKAARLQKKTTEEQTKAIDHNRDVVDDQTKAVGDQTKKTKDLTDKTKDLNTENDKATEAIKKVTQAQKQQEIATGRTTQAIERQAKTQIEAIQAQAQAAEVVERASRFPAGSSFGSDWSDYVKSQGFSIVTQAARPRATQPTQTMSFGGFGGGVQQTTQSSSNLSNLLTRYERLSEQITDFITKDVSLDIKLADAQQELRNLSVELASLNEGQLEERIKLSEQYFAQVQAVDRLQTQIAAQQQSALNQQQSSAEGIGGILDSVLADLNDLTVGDISGAIPVEKFDLLKKQFEATSAAIDKIDFSEITKADQELIAQFSNVSKTFLEQAKTVFGNDANYESMQNDVKKEFDDLAANLVTAMAAADPTTFEDNLNKLKTSFAFLDEATKNLTTSSEGAKDSISGDGNLNSSLAGLKTKSDSATSALSGDGKLNSSIDGLGTASTTTKTKTGTFAETLASLETQLDENSTATKETKKETTDLSNTLVSTTNPISVANTNLQAIASNTEQIFGKILADSNALKVALNQEKDEYTQKKLELEQIETFGQYVETNGKLQGLTQAGGILQSIVAGDGDIKIAAGGQEAYIKRAAGTVQSFYNSFGALVGTITKNEFGEEISNTLGSNIYDSRRTTETTRYIYDYFAGGKTQQLGITSRPFAQGAWNINGTVQPAMLHRGEMVIRQDDAPAVRSYLSSTGASSKYGAPMSEAPSYDTARTIELLSLILEQLRDQRDPTVYLNARKVSEELQRYRGLSA